MLYTYAEMKYQAQHDYFITIADHIYRCGNGYIFIRFFKVVVTGGDIFCLLFPLQMKWCTR